MAGKRKIELFIEIDNEKDFQNSLKAHADQLICAEIYCTFAGHCTALDRLFTQMKLDWGNGKVALLRVAADEIEALSRFKDHSEPVFMFICNNKVTKVFRGMNCIKFAEVAKKEVYLFLNGLEDDRHMYEIDEATPDEIQWLTRLSVEKNQENLCLIAKRAGRNEAHKRHRAELMVPYLESLDFVLYWPHCVHAHPELYERWDANNIVMVGREAIELTEEMAKDVLYSGDAPINEASIHKLLSGPALAICFRLLDTDKHFVTLVRKILYEDLPVYNDRKSSDDQMPRLTAFDYYKTISPTREEILRKRCEEKERVKEEKAYKNARRLSEMQRLARQQIEDILEARRMEKEQQKLEYLKTGNLSALRELEAKPDDTEVDIVVPEELPKEYVLEESSEEENENEYFPPPGLLIPGFYSPPNDIAKAHGLALLFPKIVADYVEVQPELLPPHVLVLLEITKRYKAIEAIADYKKHIIHMGIFKATSPYDSIHIAYTFKQYDTLGFSQNQDHCIAFMMSIETDIPLLQLMDLNPLHVSRDHYAGEDECAAMFPVDYADSYDEFEDFHSGEVNHYHHQPQDVHC